MHRVKCSICGQTFDRDKIEFVATSSRRYAHRSCYEKQQNGLSEEEKFKQQIYDYTLKLFGSNFNKKRIELQLKKMMTENVEFTYSGILKTLVYWYEVKRGDVEKSHYSIGIIPYVYNDAREYYRQLWMTQQLNADKDIDQFIPKIKVVTIPAPQRNPIKKRKHFQFLEQEVN